MKRKLRILRPVVFIGIGLLLALAAAWLSSSTHTPADLKAAAFFQAGTPTPMQKPVSEVGSTDGITLMSVIIVLIVILPILIKRKSWAR